mmetsp:Transcript_24202/g.73982  ORF Transcript_24202/g.73982 Transcript_24202/m.73982 type:complete len:208 (+) Transcript_24202:1248-1871(+)
MCSCRGSELASTQKIVGNEPLAASASMLSIDGPGTTFGGPDTCSLPCIVVNRSVSVGWLRAERRETSAFGEDPEGRCEHMMSIAAPSVKRVSPTRNDVLIFPRSSRTKNSSEEACHESRFQNTATPSPSVSAEDATARRVSSWVHPFSSGILRRRVEATFGPKARPFALRASNRAPTRGPDTALHCSSPIVTIARSSEGERAQCGGM